MLNGGSMIWGFFVYFLYMIPLETDVLRKHRFQTHLFDEIIHFSMQFSAVLNIFIVKT